MVQRILVNMRVCPGPSFPEPGMGLQFAGLGDMEWQALVSKTYASGWSGDINTGEAWSLKICTGRGGGVF